MEDNFEILQPLLKDDIEKGKCVLFLGPELLVNKEGKFYKSYFREIESKSGGSVKYLARENLFSITGQTQLISKIQLIRQIEEFYEDSGDDIILNLISRMPFSLIVNVAQDISINKVFSKNQYDFVEAYFPDPESKNLDAPTKEKPVIYNIFGRIDKMSSTIVTHDDLFKVIRELMQNDKIPASISNFLKNAGSFIFLGMKFETWYYQLLLSILGINNSTSVRFGAATEIEVDTVSIMDSCFQIQFTKSNPQSVIQRIYDSLESENKLRNSSEVRPRSNAYFSYAWNDKENNEREWFVDKLYNELKNTQDIIIMRDRNVLTIQDSIESYMNMIGKGKVVIMVVSDKYLKSEYCMYEAWEVFRNSNFDTRAFLARLSDVDLSDSGMAAYIQYWETKKEELSNFITTTFRENPESSQLFVKRITNISYISIFIAQFLGKLKDTICFKVPEKSIADAPEEKIKFDGFTHLITDKLHV